LILMLLLMTGLINAVMVPVNRLIFYFLQALLQVIVNV